MKKKQIYPFTDYSPKTETRLKKLLLLGERGTLRRWIQDGMVGVILGYYPFRERKMPTTFSDDEIRKLHPKAEIIKRGAGGVAIELETNARERQPKITSRTPRITPKVGRLR